MLERKYYIPYGDSFDRNFMSYFSEKNSNKIIKDKIDYFIYKKRFTLDNTGATYRAINHWTSKGLIDDDRENSKWWRKFNLMELLWISIISELRKFDIGINKLLKIKNHLLEQKEVFELFISNAYFNKREIKLIVFENWEADLIWDIELENSKILTGYLNYISISFTSIIEKVLDKKIKRTEELSLIPISEKEKSLIFKIFENEDTSFSIKTKNGRIKKYKMVDENIKKIKDIKNTNIRKLIDENINSKICIYTNNNWKITNINLVKNSD